MPSLPVREDMHEKRNEARAKLSALSSQRWAQLVEDVLRELVGRYPELDTQSKGVQPRWFFSYRICCPTAPAHRWANMTPICTAQDRSPPHAKPAVLRPPLVASLSLMLSVYYTVQASF